MNFLSTVPTLLLAALTFSGTSLQTPVEDLEHRQLPTLPTLPTALDVELQFLRTIAFSIGDAAGIATGITGAASINVNLAPALAEALGLIQAALARAQNLATTTSQELQNTVVTAESQVVTAVTELVANLVNKAKDLGDDVKNLVSGALTNLSGPLTALLDKLTGVVGNLPAAISNHDTVVQLFTQAQTSLKVGT